MPDEETSYRHCRVKTLYVQNLYFSGNRKNTVILKIIKHCFVKVDIVELYVVGYLHVWRWRVSTSEGIMLRFFIKVYCKYVGQKCIGYDSTANKTLFSASQIHKSLALYRVS